MTVVSKTELIALPVGLTTKDEVFASLKNGISKYLKDDDIKLVEKAYCVADKCHAGQKRKSGEDYIIHPICVAIILANLHMDADTLAAGLLHDVVEDTDYTIETLKNEFSEHIALLVEGVTKLTELNLVNDKVEKQAENLRHMFIAMSKDIRVIIIKLADRLHNLKTLEYQTKEKQQEKALETIEIYSPLAGRLGISRIKSEMDDLSLMYLKPNEFIELQKGIKVRREAREKFIEDIIESVKHILDEAEIKAEIKGRVKNLFSIYKKLHSRVQSIDEIYDLFAIRVFVKDIKDCYATLGVIHEHYTPIPGRFKDYIAMPKPNGYQSLHTTVIGKNGIPFEIQIRTYEMDHIAEFGVAAHWAYKEQGNSKGVKNLEDLNQANWFKDILNANAESEDSKEFLTLVKDDLNTFTQKIYCFTPEGDVISLPQGSTPIDFAYMIHSAIGNKMVGAKVNGNLVTIDYQIKNGDQVSIITSGNSNGPSRDWLKICKSAQAKSKIQHWFKKERREDNIIIGKELAEKYAKSHRIDTAVLFKEEYLRPCFKKYTAESLDDIYAMIGHGGIKESQFFAKLQDEYNKKHVKEITDENVLENIEQGKKKKSGDSVISVNGASGLSVHYAKCCSPVPGDEIIGFVTRGRGITIHRTDCVNIMNIPEVEKDRLIEISWDADENNKQNYLVSVNIYCMNRKGILVDVSRLFTENNLDIDNLETRKSKDDKATIIVSFEINDKNDLTTIITKLRSIDGVIDVTRA
ncbi:MAG: bifunctional (p)ppGpp synthetase/guanosine-3',5'-bis(diphosphate) 3'-pyrophosphohydrolase [Lachnospiraceae bacterium]|nr:bifunctional (p)ppGpp synthetase/guanosine-3',5'-bis(diphosphate) 3'-pyrophosphohydrolase [Lachnospiraceae bacterium]